MSAADFEVAPVEVPVAETWLLEMEETGDGGEPDSWPVVALDFDSATPHAAEVMLAMISRPEGGPPLEVLYEPWWPLPLLGHSAAPHVRSPQVVFTVPSGEPTRIGQPVPAIRFRLAVDQHGGFMRLATQAHVLGISAALPADFPRDAEAPIATVLACRHDPRHLGWVELQAWRGAFALDRPGGVQQPLSLD